MGTYFFFSGFDREKGFTPNIAESLRENITDKKSLAFIASNPCGHEKTDFHIKYIVNWFYQAGLNFETVYILDDRKTVAECADIIKNASAVFLCGGTTLLQIEFIRKYNLVPLLKKFNGAIMGMSAGAINMGISSFYSADKDYDNTHIYEGIGLANISVEPHFSLENTILIEKDIFPFSEKIDIYAMCDDSAIVCRNHNRQFIGDIYLVSKGIIEKVNQMELVLPTLEHSEAALTYRQEWLDADPKEKIHGSWGFQNQRYENYELWLSEVENLRTTPMPSINVPASTYFVFVNNKIVGNIQIRHSLNESLLQNGGHIGYGVRPSERRKGYATKMLALALEKCRALGIDKALITCDKGNVGSVKTVLKNGGVLENEFTEDNGNIVQRYWITLNNMEVE